MVGMSRCFEVLYTQLTVWVIIILNHSDIRVILSRREGSLAWFRDPNGIENINTLEYPNHIGNQNYEILVVDAQMVS